MSRITWDAPEDRLFEYGVSKGVHYMKGANGVYNIAAPWNGLSKVTDKPTGAESNKLWADGIEYANLRSGERYGCGIEAYTYPPQFSECDGSAQPVEGMYVGQQTRKPFGLCWRTEIGNADNSELGYKLHLAYGLTVSPSEVGHDTVNENVNANTFSWDGDGSPVPFTGYKPTAKITIDSTMFTEAKMTELEAVLYGSDTTIYVKTTDATKQAGKTYYTRSGTASNYTYTEFTGSTFTQGTDYFEAVTAGPRLPLPDEVYSILHSA